MPRLWGTGLWYGSPVGISKRVPMNREGRRSNQAKNLLTAIHFANTMLLAESAGALGNEYR